MTAQPQEPEAAQGPRTMMLNDDMLALLQRMTRKRERRWIGEISTLAETDEARAVAALLADHERLAGEVERLKAALPDPKKLMDLALWFDLKDAKEGRLGENEVQDDLRRWAHASRRAALSPEERPATRRDDEITPEEQARRDMREIAERHAPALRAAVASTPAPGLPEDTAALVEDVKLVRAMLEEEGVYVREAFERLASALDRSALAVGEEEIAKMATAVCDHLDAIHSQNGALYMRGAMPGALREAIALLKGHAQ